MCNRKRLMSPAISPNVFKNACGIECCFQLCFFLWLWLTRAHARTHSHTNTHQHTHTEPYIFVNENIAFIKWVMHFVNWIQAYSRCWVTDVLMDVCRLLFPPLPPKPLWAPSHWRRPRPHAGAQHLLQAHEVKRVKSTNKSWLYFLAVCVCACACNVNGKLKP